MKSSIYLLFASVIFVLLPVFAARPMTSLFAERLQASIIEIGIISSCYSITPLILAIFAGKYIDKYGEKLPLFIGSFGIFVSLLLPFLFPVIATLYISQLILGGSQLLAILAIQNGVSKSATDENRDKAVGSFSFFSSLGILLGPLIGGYATEHLGFKLSFLLLGSFAIVSLVISMFLSNSKRTVSATAKTASGNFLQVFSNKNLSRSIIVSMIILSGLDIFYVYFPLYAKSIGLSLSQIGLVLAAQATMNSLVLIFMPNLVSKFGRVKVLWLFMALGAVSYGFIPFMDLFVTLLITALFLGTGLGVTQPLTIILTYNSSPPGRSGEVLGIRLASNRLAQTTIPFLFASLSNLIGLGAIFIIKALLLMVGAWVARGIVETNTTAVENKKSS